MKYSLSVPILFLGLLTIGCQTDTDSQKQEEEQVADQVIPVMQLTTRPTTLEHDYAGHLEAVQNVEVRARISGYLDKILVDEGKAVSKGQVMFKLSDAEYQVEIAQANASLESAQAQAQSAQVEMGRTKLLVDKDIISASELKLANAKIAAAQASIDQAKAALSNARLRVAMTSIKAPFNGIINRIPYKVGSLIEQGTLLTTVSDISQIYAYFNVSEKEYLAFIKKRRDPTKTATSEVDLVLADDSHYPYPGKIETTETVFEGNSGTIAFRAKFPNPKQLLRHGATGKITLDTDVNDALLVPQKAVFEVQDKNFVYVVDANNQVKARSFVPRSRIDQFYIVQSGLQAGERIVYEGTQNIKDGMKIVPKPVSADSLRIMYAAIQ